MLMTMTRMFLRLSPALLLALLPVTIWGQNLPTAPLTLQQVIDIVRVKNPTLLSDEQNLFSVKAQEITAGLRVNPDFAVAASNVTLPAQSVTNTFAYAFQVSRLFERGQKRRWRLENARRITDQTQNQYKDSQRQAVFAVKQAFTNMLLAKSALQLAQQNVSTYRQTVELSKARLDAGDMSKFDFERIDLQLAGFESDLDNARLTLVEASAQLQLLMGYDHPRNTFDITGSLAPPSLPLNLADLEQKALASRPDYLAAQAAVRAADANIKLNYALGTTDPILEGEYDRSGTDNSAGFNINVPLRIFDRNQGGKEVSKYLAQSSRFAQDAARNQVISDVDQAWASYTTALSQAQRYNGHYLKEADEVLSIAEFSYRKGGAALLEYLDALREYRQINLQALTANAQVWMAIHQLSTASAHDLVLP